MKRGAVVCERYALGQTRETRWISFSMAKSISSTLIGAAIQDGLIASIDEPIVRTVAASERDKRGTALHGRRASMRRERRARLALAEAVRELGVPCESDRLLRAPRR